MRIDTSIGGVSKNMRKLMSKNYSCGKLLPGLATDEGRAPLSIKSSRHWAEVFAGDAVMASAALDRLLHRCTIINIRGESFRLKEKRQAARSTLNALLDTSAQPAPTTKEETAMT